MQTWDQNDQLDLFLKYLSPSAGFQYITLLMLNQLLQKRKGYNARVRHVLMKLVLVILRHEMRERVYHDYYCNDLEGEDGGNSGPNSNDSNNMNGTTTSPESGENSSKY